MTNIRSPKEIAKIKRDWAAAPNWNLEDTIGFEAHREELMIFRVKCEAEWSRGVEAALDAKAIELGCPGDRNAAAAVLFG